MFGRILAKLFQPRFLGLEEGLPKKASQPVWWELPSKFDTAIEIGAAEPAESENIKLDSSIASAESLPKMISIDGVVSKDYGGIVNPDLPKEVSRTLNKQTDHHFGKNDVRAKGSYSQSNSKPEAPRTYADLTANEQRALSAITGFEFTSTSLVSDAQYSVVSKLSGIDFSTLSTSPQRNSPASRSVGQSRTETKLAQWDSNENVRGHSNSVPARDAKVASDGGHKATTESFSDQARIDRHAHDNHVLNEEQLRVFNYVERSRNNVFITGRAGSGKSFLLRYLAARTRKQAIVVAPTGVAALNAEGATIHSTFGLPWGFLNEKLVDEAASNLSFHRAVVLRNLDLLIVDEISMVPADMLLALDQILRRVRETDTSFGGVQVVLFGDPYQLKPVVTEKSLKQYYSDVWGSSYFFSSPAWKTGGFGKIELSLSHRQSDGDFLEALDSIRRGKVRFSHLELINSRQVTEYELPVSGAIRMSSTNRAVNQFNYERLNELPGSIHRFVGSYLGDFDKDMKRVVAPDILELKVGAQVMILANDGAKRWVNGSTAEIAEFVIDDETGSESIWIEIEHSFHEVSRHKWKQLRHTYNRFEASIGQEITGEFHQYPMTLGWARTIHKSQGQTYDKCVFDLNEGVFASGQAYVALSRCRTLEGLYLNKALEMTDIRVDDYVREFMSELTPASQLPSN